MAHPTPSPACHDSVELLYSDDHPDSIGLHTSSALSQSQLQNQLNAPLRTHVERIVREYFLTLGEDVPTNLYELILREVELPLLMVTLEQTRGNQSKCAQVLGLNRGTLRKKLKTYDLMS